MFRFLRSLRRNRHAEMDEAAFVFPLLLLLTFGLLNFGMLGFAAVSAANAANYGARMGSAAQANQVGIAASAAQTMLSDNHVGSYHVTVAGGGTPGQVIRVQVTYRVPNIFAGFASFFGVATSTDFSGSARSDFRQEGW